MPTTNDPARASLPDAAQNKIRDLLRTLPERKVSSMLGISRQTLGRCLAGMPVLRGTVALVTQRLDEIAIVP